MAGQSLLRRKSFESKCRMVCIREEYEQLRKAFFEKEKNNARANKKAESEVTLCRLK